MNYLNAYHIQLILKAFLIPVSMSFTLLNTFLYVFIEDIFVIVALFPCFIILAFDYSG